MLQSIHSDNALWHAQNRWVKMKELGLCVELVPFGDAKGTRQFRRATGDSFMNILDLKTFLTNIREKYNNQLHQSDLDELDNLIKQCDVNSESEAVELRAKILGWISNLIKLYEVITDLIDGFPQ